MASGLRSSTDAPDQYLDGVEQSQSLLGGGSYGAVMRGQWDGVPVAIKRHYPVLLRDETGQMSKPYQAFLDEFRLLRDHPHPCVVQVFGLIAPTGPGEAPGLVMELLSTTLRIRYGQEPLLAVDQEAHIGLCVASGLKFLHSHGLIHRDLTTNNILMAERPGPGSCAS